MAQGRQVILVIPRMQLGRGENMREHWAARAKRVARERWQVQWAWQRAKPRLPPPPWAVTMVRCSPANGLDFVNLVTSFKGVQDQIAEELKLRDDRDAKGGELDRATWTYREDTHTPWALRIEIATR